MSDKERLFLVLVLCEICVNQDPAQLKYFISVGGRSLETNDFNSILRKSIKILDERRCGKMSCPDWLMGELFNLYKTDLGVKEGL